MLRHVCCCVSLRAVLCFVMLRGGLDWTVCWVGPGWAGPQAKESVVQSFASAWASACRQFLSKSGACPFKAFLAAAIFRALLVQRVVASLAFRRRRHRWQRWSRTFVVPLLVLRETLCPSLHEVHRSCLSRSLKCAHMSRHLM